MSVAGGYAPQGAIGAELEAITHRSFIPAVIVQIGQATPYLAAMLSNAQPASGGLASITVPIQGAPLVTPQATDFFGSFDQPTEQVGLQDAAMNLCAVVVPIGFLGFQALVQLDAAVVPKIEAVMNDVGQQTAAFLTTDFLTNATAGTIHVDGLPLIGNNTGLYANIDRTTINTFWRGNKLAAPGGTPAPTRKLVSRIIASAAKANGGEMPTHGLCGLGTWSLLQEDFQGLEIIQRTPADGMAGGGLTMRSGFNALLINGVPIYADLGVPEGTFYFFNTRYLSAYIHEAAAFVFTGFASMMPVRQIGYIGAMIVVLQQVCTKPASITTAPGYGSNSL